jgi:hypothetical protein
VESRLLSLGQGVFCSLPMHLASNRDILTNENKLKWSQAMNNQAKDSMASIRGAYGRGLGDAVDRLESIRQSFRGLGSDLQAAFTSEG